jgi:DNA helicase II / ATP-dependent DNA helicase PcrA
MTAKKAPAKPAPFFTPVTRDVSPIVEPAPLTAKEWSAYQLAIYADMADGEGHTVVQARAGSGKSTTAEEGVRRIPTSAKVLVVAFNKPIAEAMKLRLADLGNVDVSTCHSYGLRQLRRPFGANVDNDKCDILARDMVGHGHAKDDWSPKARRALCRLVSLCKSTLAKLPEQVDALIDAFDIDCNGFLDMTKEDDRKRLVEAALHLLQLCKEETSVVDFDDMVWFPVVHDLSCWQYDFVVVDETQDLNAVQVELILKACKRGGRVVCFGDSRQAIYGFRGASSDAMVHLQKRLGAKELKLTVSYRCARKIVAEAKKIVPDFEAAPHAVDGTIELASYVKMLAEAKPGEFILSRANAPLIGLCWTLLKAGKKVTIKGKDIGAGLLALFAKARKAGAADIAGLIKFVDVWADGERKRLLAKTPPREQAVEAVNDKVECVQALCSGAQSINEVEAKVAAIFSDDSDESKIVLSSTHKAKGLERDKVWLLAWTYGKRINIEEQNLKYVGITRAKRHLVFVDAPESTVG